MDYTPRQGTRELRRESILWYDAGRSGLLHSTAQPGSPYLNHPPSQGVRTVAVSKVIDLIGNSTVGWEDAARNALAGAAKSLHGISSLEIVQYTAKVEENEIVEYRALVRLAFVVD